MKITKKTFLLLYILSLSIVGFAQQYPFSATIVVQPPYSPYLSHYADGQDAKLLVVVTPNDNNFVQRECVMQFRIKGQGFECETDINKLFNLPSIELMGGISKTLMSYEYTPYLQPSDLVFKRGALTRGAIPQGLTQVSIQIFDKATRLPLSAEHSDVFNLSLSNPPMLNMPFDKENIPVQMFQNINFSWTPLHMGSINAAFSTEYLYELWEIYNDQVPSQQYVQTAQPLYSTTTSSPILIYGPTMPMLIEGKRYAWRVRVQAKKGFDDLELFTNNGYSQVWSFTYAANCPEPSQVLLTSPFPDQIKVQWAYQNTYQQMKISYREAGKNKWYHETTTDPEYYITQLKDNTEYEVKIAGICTGGVETYSQPATIKTQEKGKTQIPNFNCGTPPKKLDLSNKSPLPTLNAGETVTAGDFEITITEARGGGGTFSGKGYMRVPYFKLARLAITFQNVQLNTSRQLIGGYFQAVYDEANGSIANIGKGIKDVVNNIEGGMTGSTGSGAIVVANQYNGVIGSVNDIQVSASSVSIGGQSFPREAGNTTLIQDKEGKTYGVDEDGQKAEIGKQTKDAIPGGNKGGYSAGSDPTPLAKDKGQVLFAAYANQKYGFDRIENDKLKANYDFIGGEYQIPWKSVKTAGMDKVSYSGNTSGGYMLKFRTKAGFEYKPEGGSLNIVGTKHGDIQEIYAIAYKDSQDQHVIGKLQAMTLNPIKNVVYVVKTNTSQTLDKAQIKTYLDKVYDQAVMHWEVEIVDNYKPNVSLGTNGLDIGKDDTRKDLSEEMKALRDDFKKQGLVNREDQQTYYVFLVDQFSDPAIDGYFPQSKLYGFVRYSSQVNTLHKTLAHELGHGAGNLEHPFVQYQTSQGSTPLLMDYSEGSQLSKADWGMLHNPGIRTGWKDAVGEGLSVSGELFLCTIPQNLKTKLASDKIKKYFVRTDNEIGIATLPEGATPNKFYGYKGKVYLYSFIYQNKEYYDYGPTESIKDIQWRETNFVPSDSMDFYLQIAASNDNKSKILDKYKYDYSTFIQYTNEATPYKYLLGPFNSYEQVYYVYRNINENGSFIKILDKKNGNVIKQTPTIRVSIEKTTTEKMVALEFKEWFEVQIIINSASKKGIEEAVMSNLEEVRMGSITYKSTEYELDCKKYLPKINQIASDKSLTVFVSGFDLPLEVLISDISKKTGDVLGRKQMELPNYWEGIDSKFMERLGNGNAYYIDGSEDISTSNHCGIEDYSDNNFSELYKFMEPKIVEANIDYDILSQDIDKFEKKYYKAMNSLFQCNAISTTLIAKADEELKKKNTSVYEELKTTNDFLGIYSQTKDFLTFETPIDYLLIEKTKITTKINTFILEKASKINNPTVQRAAKRMICLVKLHSLLRRLYLNSDKPCQLNTQKNDAGFKVRFDNGVRDGRKLADDIYNGVLKLNKQTGKIDVVAHSMGVAHALGVVKALQERKLNIGRFYAIAPENACSSNGRVPENIEEFWQYGSDETIPKKDQDGVAPQCPIAGLDEKAKKLPTNFGRAYIPKDGSVPVGWFLSHSIGNFGWIFDIQESDKNKAGYVKPRK